MYDLQAIKDSVNLVDLVNGDTSIKKVAAQEYAGPCPKCGGKDRLHVTSSWFFCRQCHPKRGDAIEYVQWRDGITFSEACDLLGGDGHEDALVRRVARASDRAGDEHVPVHCFPFIGWCLVMGGGLTEPSISGRA